jgi:ADP-sugar diphosphatase
VAILIILRPTDSRGERYVVLAEQPRIPAGSLAFLEIPAGMIENDTFSGAAAKEVEEETGFMIPLGELVNMTELALQNSEHAETNLRNAMYPSPGGCDESIGLFLWEKELDRQEIEDLRGKLTGLRKQDEMITLRVKPYEDLWKEGVRDAKTLAAWALYEGLNRSEILEDHRKEKREMAASSSQDSQECSVKRSKITAAE